MPTQCTNTEKSDPAFLGLTFSPIPSLKLILIGIPRVAPQTFCEANTFSNLKRGSVQIKVTVAAANTQRKYTPLKDRHPGFLNLIGYKLTAHVNSSFHSSKQLQYTIFMKNTEGKNFI